MRAGYIVRCLFGETQPCQHFLSAPATSPRWPFSGLIPANAVVSSGAQIPNRVDSSQTHRNQAFHIWITHRLLKRSHCWSVFVRSFTYLFTKHCFTRGQAQYQVWGMRKIKCKSPVVKVYSNRECQELGRSLTNDPTQQHRIWVKI